MGPYSPDFVLITSPPRSSSSYSSSIYYYYAFYLSSDGFFGSGLAGVDVAFGADFFGVAAPFFGVG